jgi:hypothetical protein
VKVTQFFLSLFIVGLVLVSAPARATLLMAPWRANPPAKAEVVATLSTWMRKLVAAEISKKHYLTHTARIFGLTLANEFFHVGGGRRRYEFVAWVQRRVAHDDDCNRLLKFPVEVVVEGILNPDGLTLNQPTVDVAMFKPE